MDTNGSTLLSTHQVARMLKISEATVIRWRKVGQHLPFIHFGGQVRYHLHDVQRLLEHGTGTPRAHATKSPSHS